MGVSQFLNSSEIINRSAVVRRGKDGTGVQQPLPPATPPPPIAYTDENRRAIGSRSANADDIELGDISVTATKVDKEPSFPHIAGGRSAENRMKGLKSTIVKEKYEEEQKAKMDKERRRMRDRGLCLAPQHAKKVDKFLDSSPVVITLLFFTIFALFGADVRVLLPPSVDTTFDVLTLVAMVVFLVEMVLALIVRPSYRCSILLLFDLIAFVSLALDLSWVAEGLYEALEGGATDETLAGLTIGRAGRAARLGARTSRFTRLLRLSRLLRTLRVLRIVRIFKFYDLYRARERAKKSSMEAEAVKMEVRGGMEDSSKAGTVETIIEEEEEENKLNAELDDMPSSAWELLKEKTTRKIVFLVLITVIVTPILDYQGETNGSISAELQVLHLLWLDNSSLLLPALSTFSETAAFNESVVYFRIGDDVIVNSEDIAFVNDSRVVLSANSTLRATEYLAFWSSASGSDNVSSTVLSVNGSIVVVSTADEVKTGALFGIGLTLFVIFILGLGAFLFVYDLRRLFHRPIQRLTFLLWQITGNNVLRPGEAEMGDILDFMVCHLDQLLCYCGTVVCHLRCFLIGRASCGCVSLWCITVSIGRYIFLKAQIIREAGCVAVNIVLWLQRVAGDIFTGPCWN